MSEVLGSDSRVGLVCSSRSESAMSRSCAGESERTLLLDLVSLLLGRSLRGAGDRLDVR